MAKFLGVISNSAKSPSNDRVLEFSDLELLANYLYNETQNLYQEFQQKAQFINDRELIIQENFTKFANMYDFYQLLKKKTTEMEHEADEIGLWLCKMEKSINRMERSPSDYAACKCTSNPERNKTFDMLVKLSEDITRIESQMGIIEDLESAMPVREPFSLNNRLFPFLELHTKILQQIELKINKITDLLNEVDEMFRNAHKRITTPCYHKRRHEFASDC